MPQEIERKFLVDAAHPDLLTLFATAPSQIAQGYLKSDATGVVRVRTRNDKGYLTVKGATRGITRDEFEYEIPRPDAEAMLSMCQFVLRKERFVFQISRGLEIEVDVFSQIDLILAEIELPTENTPFDAPEWLLQEVSHDPEYFNNAIAERLKSLPRPR